MVTETTDTAIKTPTYAVNPDALYSLSMGDGGGGFLIGFDMAQACLSRLTDAADASTKRGLDVSMEHPQQDDEKTVEEKRGSGRGGRGGNGQRIKGTSAGHLSNAVGGRIESPDLPPWLHACGRRSANRLKSGVLFSERACCGGRLCLIQWNRFKLRINSKHADDPGRLLAWG